MEVLKNEAFFSYQVDLFNHNKLTREQFPLTCFHTILKKNSLQIFSKLRNISAPLLQFTAMGFYCASHQCATQRSMKTSP